MKDVDGAAISFPNGLLSMKSFMKFLPVKLTLDCQLCGKETSDPEESYRGVSL